jgi:predicted enzyme related to lactoylglutathione lyase
MRRLIIAVLALGYVVLLGAAPEPLTYDHIHLAFPDTHAATEWYIKYLGATARPDGADGVFFGPIRFNMLKSANVVGSPGSVIDAVGLSYADLQARLRIVLDGSGAKIVQPQHEVAGLGQLAVIEDPWGTKIELVQDSQLLGFHHARVRAVDPAAMRAWFVDRLGADSARIGDADALKFGGVWLIVDKADAQPRASSGTTLDHLGFRTKDIKTEIANFQASSVKVLGDPRQDPNVSTTFATFFEGPTGRIELTQR